MTDYLLDTNHATHLLSDASQVGVRIRSHAQQGDVFGISMTVLAELFFAVEASRRRQQNLASLEAFLNVAVLWDFDRPAAEEFGKISTEQKRKGRRRWRNKGAA